MTTITIIWTSGYIACGGGTHYICGVDSSKAPKSGSRCQCQKVRVG